MSRNRAIIKVSYEDLLLYLGLPADVTLIGTIQEPIDIVDSVIQIMIEHDDFPPRLRGFAVRVLTLSEARELAEAVIE